MKGLQLKEKLSRKGLNGTQVAELLGISHQAFFSLMKSEDIKSGTIERISEATGIPITELYGIGHSATASGDGSTAVAGYGNTVTGSSEMARALEEIGEQRKLVAKAQEQIDRLISIIEKR
ncbi:MAG: hypothetical protein NC206_11705 [Bacteroides sp.]|nr:hypothetical protein [Bacteroides sp.]